MYPGDHNNVNSIELLSAVSRKLKLTSTRRLLLKGAQSCSELTADEQSLLLSLCHIEDKQLSDDLRLFKMCYISRRLTQQLIQVCTEYFQDNDRSGRLTSWLRKFSTFTEEGSTLKDTQQLIQKDLNGINNDLDLFQDYLKLPQNSSTHDDRSQAENIFTDNVRGFLEQQTDPYNDHSQALLNFDVIRMAFKANLSQDLVPAIQMVISGDQNNIDTVYNALCTANIWSMRGNALHELLKLMGLERSTYWQDIIERDWKMLDSDFQCCIQSVRLQQSTSFYELPNQEFSIRASAPPADDVLLDDARRADCLKKAQNVENYVEAHQDLFEKFERIQGAQGECGFRVVVKSKVSRSASPAFFRCSQPIIEYYSAPHEYRISSAGEEIFKNAALVARARGDTVLDISEIPEYLKEEARRQIAEIEGMKVIGALMPCAPPSEEDYVRDRVKETSPQERQEPKTSLYPVMPRPAFSMGTT